MIDLFSKLRKKETDAQQSAEAAYTALVEKTAAGKATDPDIAAGILERAGKTVEQLERAVGSIHSFQRLRALVATRPQVERELAAVKAREAALSKEQEEFQARVGPLFLACYEQRTKVIPAKIAEIDAAERQLIQWGSAELKAERDAADADVFRLEERERYLNDAYQRTLGHAADYRRRAKEANKAGDRDAILAEAERYDRGAAEIEAERSELSRQKQAARQRSEAAQQKMITG